MLCRYLIPILFCGLIAPMTVHAQSEPVHDEPSPTTAAEPFLDLRNEDVAPAVSPAQSDQPDMSTLIDIAAWTVVVLSLFGLCVLAFRYLKGNHKQTPTNAAKARIVESLSLGMRGEVSLIELDGIRIVVGSDASGFKAIGFPPMGFTDHLSQAESLDESESMSEEDEQNDTIAAPFAPLYSRPQTVPIQ